MFCRGADFYSRDAESVHLRPGNWWAPWAARPAGRPIARQARARRWLRIARMAKAVLSLFPERRAPYAEPKPAQPSEQAPGIVSSELGVADKTS